MQPMMVTLRMHTTPTPERERSAHAADRVRRSVGGPMWHGSAVNALLAGVTHGDAASRPIPGAHSIWELVLHMTTWAEIAKDRLQGNALGDPSRARDFPPVPARTSARAWTSARRGLTAAHAQLADTVAALTDDALSAVVRRRTYTVGAMIDGVIEHTTYHGGQIALLRRACAATAVGG